mmetsp:Transcript_36007/g.101199  ORF Transcript_36007/g.101199 Transcript_36007/m.101199 type:complete len:216 (-) Transcript_36007:230-877(-)
MQPYVTAFASRPSFDIASHAWRTLSMFPARPYALTIVPYVTAEPRMLYSFIFVSVASSLGMSFILQKTSRSEFTRTSSTSSCWVLRKCSTNRTPRGARRLSPRSVMPLVRMDTVYLSARSPRRCMSSKTSHASSRWAGPARAIVSISRFSEDSFGATPRRGISSRTIQRASSSDPRVSRPRSTALKAAALTRRASAPPFMSPRRSRASGSRPAWA